MNHRLGLEINFVELSEFSFLSENPSEVSSFCNLANIISDTVAAKSPVGQSIKTAIRNGRTKNSDLPTTLSRNSRDFRGAISIKEPDISKPAIVNIVSGECNTEYVFVTQEIKVKSISSLAGGGFVGALAFGDVALAFGDVALAFGDVALGKVLLSSFRALGEEGWLLASLLASLRAILLEPQSF